MTFYLAALALALTGIVVPDPARVEHARGNYEALASGQMHWNQLAPHDLAELRALAEAIRQQIRTSRTASERCFDQEFGRYGKTLTDLQQRLIDLRCRPIGDGLGN